MKLATTTHDFSRYYKNNTDMLRAVAGVGFKYIDLSFDAQPMSESAFNKPDWKDEVKRLKECADELGVTFVQSHAPSGNPFVKGESFDMLVASTIRAIEVCGELGIPNTVVHPGWDGQMSLEEYCERNMDFYKRLFPAAEKTGVYILIENTTHANMTTIHQNIFTAKDMLTFLEIADHPLMGCCWDTGHANCEPGFQSKDIIELGDALKAIHFNDNRGERDEHLAPFCGNLCIDDVMNGLIASRFAGPFTLECCSTLRPSKYWLGNRKTLPEKSKVTDPTLEMQIKAEEMLYLAGKHILDSYGLWEE